MNLQRARYLLAVADCGSFTRAAAQIHVAQSALSQQIKVFERELGVTLFDRSGPRIRLTPAGEVAVREARFLVSSADRAVERIRAAEAGGGEIRIVHTRSWAGGAVARAIDDFRARHPEIALSEQRGFTAWNLDMLQQGRVDVAVVRTPVRRAGVVVRRVDDEELMVAVPADHRFASSPDVDPVLLRDEPVVFWPRENGPGMHDEIERLLWPDAPPNVVRNEADDEQVLHAVAAGVGIAPMPIGRARAFRVPGVHLCRVAGPPRRLGVGLAHRSDDPNPAVALLMECAAPVG